MLCLTMQGEVQNSATYHFVLPDNSPGASSLQNQAYQDREDCPCGP